MSAYYQKQGISSCEIAGAVALAALHDLHVNLFTFAGFPQISVSEAPNKKFNVAISWRNQEGKISTVNFELEDKVAFVAAKRFKEEFTYDLNIFKSVQNALVTLESGNAS